MGSEQRLPGDPCPRAWSAVDPRAVIREAAEAMKEQLKEHVIVEAAPGRVCKDGVSLRWGSAWLRRNSEVLECRDCYLLRSLLSHNFSVGIYALVGNSPASPSLQCGKSHAGSQAPTDQVNTRSAESNATQNWDESTRRSLFTYVNICSCSKGLTCSHELEEAQTIVATFFAALLAGRSSLAVLWVLFDMMFA